MTRLPFRLVPLALACALASGCAPDNLTDFDFGALQPPQPPDEPTGDALVGTATDGGLTVELTAARGGPHLGYVRLGLRVTDGGVAVPQARIRLAATPDGGPAAGAALPVESPADRAGDDGVFRGAAFLLAPDTTARAFTVHATVETNGKTATVAFPLRARRDLWMQTAGSPASLLLVSWVDPLRPVVGENAFEVAVHRWDGTAFRPVDGASARLYPYMDMGGGDGHSTPYRGPDALGAGRYRWTVDFIMSGGWEMTVTLTPPGGAADEVRFVGYTVYDR